jgi:putative PIN family toxin of toxin-antitoxin system
MRKVVLDTNVLVSALWSQQGNPYTIVEMLFTGDIVLYYDTEMFEEYTEVLCRAKFGFSKNKVLDLLREITRNGILSVSTVSEAVFPDETDRKFYDMAKSNEAVLVTGNIKHYPDESFILSPLEFLRKTDV